MLTQVSESTTKKIQFFKQHFFDLGYGDGHYYFACHAAFPLAMTPNLLHQLWANFKNYTDPLTNEIKTIDGIAVSDILLSPICKEVNREVFEMDMETRAFLLNELEEKFGRKRMEKLGYFLYQFIQEVAITKHNKAFIEAQTWTALATIAPRYAVNELAESLKSAIQNRKNGEIMRLRNLLESYANQEAAFENLVHYSKGIKAAILNYPKEVIKEQIDKSNAKILTIEEGVNLENTILKIPMLEEIEQEIEVPAETVTNKKSKALIIIEKEKKEKTGFLNLSKMKLDNIPPQVFELIHLKELILGENNISEIPNTIINLKNLEKLVLSQNPIQHIPTSIGRLTNLKEFKLNSGQLNDFPNTLLEIIGISHITLENNQIDFLPRKIEELRNLKNLDLTGNPVMNLPKNLLKTSGRKIRQFFEEIKPDGKSKPLFFKVRFDENFQSKLLFGLDFHNSINIDLFPNKAIETLEVNLLDPLALYKQFQKYGNRIKILQLVFDSTDNKHFGSDVERGYKKMLKLIGELPNCELIVSFANLPHFGDTLNKKLKIAFLDVINKNRRRANLANDLATFYKHLINGKSIQEAYDRLSLDESFFEQEGIKSNNPIQIPNVLSLNQSPPKQNPFELFPKIDLEELKDSLKNDISKALTKNVLEKLEEILIKDTPHFHEILSLSSRFRSEEQSIRMGTITFEQQNITLSQIDNVLLELINELQEEDLNAYLLLNKIPFPKKAIKLSDRFEQAIEPMPVNLYGDELDKTKFLEYYQLEKSPHLNILEKPSSKAEFGLEVSSNDLRIIKLKDRSLVHGIKGFNSATINYIKTKLESIEKWNRISELSNESSIDPKQIQLVFVDESREGKPINYDGNRILIDYPQVVTENRGRKHYINFLIKAKNLSSRKLFLAVLFLGAKYDIQSFRDCREIESNSAWENIVENYALWINNDKWNEVTDLFKFIVSTSEFSIDTLLEEGLQLGEVISLSKTERRISRRGIYSVIESEVDQEWFTKDIRVTLKRSEPKKKTIPKKTKSKKAKSKKTKSKIRKAEFLKDQKTIEEIVRNLQKSKKRNLNVKYIYDINTIINEIRLEWTKRDVSEFALNKIEDISAKLSSLNILMQEQKSNDYIGIGRFKLLNEIINDMMQLSDSLY